MCEPVSPASAAISRNCGTGGRGGRSIFVGRRVSVVLGRGTGVVWPSAGRVPASGEMAKKKSLNKYANPSFRVSRRFLLFGKTFKSIVTAKRTRLIFLCRTARANLLRRNDSLPLKHVVKLVYFQIF